MKYHLRSIYLFSLSGENSIEFFRHNDALTYTRHSTFKINTRARAMRVQALLDHLEKKYLTRVSVMCESLCVSYRLPLG